MTFTSYAQNFEDVMLWRALKHVKNGFYVDVGAQDPVIDSVSKGFYEHGWRGIHVEPVPEYAEMLRRDRPDETVLQLALSDRTGLLELSVIADTGLSTAVKAYAENHESVRGFKHQTIKVPTLPIRSALEHLAGQDVHWLKIDVEGFEEDVLRGWDSSQLRPWLIVIEATIPMSTEKRYAGADQLLRDAHYQFVYFDGLNRFYVAAEHADLAQAFAAPPNVFDEAHLSGLSSSPWCRHVMARAEQQQVAFAQELNKAREAVRTTEEQASERIAQAEASARDESARAARAEVRSAGAEARLAQAETRAAEAESFAAAADLRAAQADTRASAAAAHVQALLGSTSWRMAAPLRLVVSAFRGRLEPHSVERLAALSRRLGIFRPARFVYRLLLRKRASPVAAAAASSRPSAPSTPPPPRPVGAPWSAPADLTEDARRVYLQLKPQAREVQGTV